MNDLQITEYKNIRVLTTQQIAEAYETDGKIISYNFNHNKERYVSGKHYILLEGEELRAFREIHDLPSNLNRIYLWTEKGAFLHAKSLNTDKAWEVYDRLVDNYFNKPQKKLSDREMMRLQLEMYDEHEERISNLENTMNIDYGQQRVLEKEVAAVVINALGGKNANAYKEMAKKVFAECNRDIKDYFNVNSRNNIPRLKFDEAVQYIKSWIPCTNTRMSIEQYNAQLHF